MAFVSSTFLWEIQQDAVILPEGRRQSTGD